MYYNTLKSQCQEKQFLHGIFSFLHNFLDVFLNIFSYFLYKFTIFYLLFYIITFNVIYLMKKNLKTACVFTAFCTILNNRLKLC